MIHHELLDKLEELRLDCRRNGFDEAADLLGQAEDTILPRYDGRVHNSSGGFEFKTDKHRAAVIRRIAGIVA